MNHASNDDLDRVLLREENREDNIVPSSGFAASVMDAVHKEAMATAPIRFPWKRALPGLAACLALAAVMITNFAASFGHSSVGVTGWPASDGILLILKKVLEGSGTQAGIGWIVLALLLSLITTQLSMRIAAGRN